MEEQVDQLQERLVEWNRGSYEDGCIAVRVLMEWRRMELYQASETDDSLEFLANKNIRISPSIVDYTVASE